MNLMAIHGMFNQFSIVFMDTAGCNSRGVREAIVEIINESTYIYQNLLATYSATNIKLLEAIAKEKCGKKVNVGEFIATYNLRAASSVNTSLKKLVDKEFVYKTVSGYILYNRFFSIWLREQSY